MVVRNAPPGIRSGGVSDVVPVMFGAPRNQIEREFAPIAGPESDPTSALHPRTRLLGCLTVAVLALVSLILAAPAAASTLGTTYLALGDSLAYGYHQAQYERELPNVDPATFNHGYVDDFADVLRLGRPNLQVINDGCPGETTSTFLNGSGVTGYCAGAGPTGQLWPDKWLHHPYLDGGSQLSDALAILAANPNVSPITLDLGSNDALAYLEHNCGFPAADTCTSLQVAGNFVGIIENIATIVKRLHAAAPNAEIVVLGLFNAYPELLTDGDINTALLNLAIDVAVSSVPNVSFANPEPLFNPAGEVGKPESGDLPAICAFTGMCPGGTYDPTSPDADIHPTSLGYAVLAGVIGLDYVLH